jgi:glucosamine kinase
LEKTYFLGIDGGGSKCKARLEDADGNFLGEYVSGPANPMRDYELAMTSLKDVIAGVFATANLNIDNAANTHAVMGLAGLNIPCCLTKMSQWQHPFATLQLTTDLHIACVGAHERTSGAIVIIGTGSSGLVCEEGRQLEYGGHGFSLGDKGSGAWFGAESIRYALETIDKLQPSSRFTVKLIESLDCQSAQNIVEVFAQASPAQFAQYAPLLFDYADLKDPVAVKIVKEGSLYINQLCQQLLQKKPQGLSLIGGLSDKVAPWLTPEIQAQITPALNSPEVGAVLIARQQQALEKNNQHSHLNSQQKTGTTIPDNK